ncbi:MAG: CHAT domain-containing protein [Caldilineaceae bacterium]
MAMQGYANFDLVIERSATGYCARVFDSPAGQAAVDFISPFSPEEQAAIIAANWSTTAERAFKFGGDDRFVPPSLATKTVGERLYATVFQGDVRSCLLISLAQQPKLRIRLRMNDVPDLAALPWEYLHGPAPYDFFALSTQTPVVRYLEMLQGATPLQVQTPLHVLVLLSDPTDVAPRLDVEREWTRLKTTLEVLEQRGLIVLERSKANLDSLQQRLQQQTKPVHILHFIGHGAFDEPSQTGGLLFEDANGSGQFVSADKFSTLLYDHLSLRLAFLNSCEGARSGPANLFAGLAQTLAQKRLPAVLAMQYTMSDNAAIELAASFYQALAHSYPVDAALAEARKTLYTQTNRTEWGTPVLFMRAPDGMLFQVKSEQEEAVAEKKPSARQNLQFNTDVYIGGGVNTGGGKYVGRDNKTKIVYDDEVHGDKIAGDKFFTKVEGSIQGTGNVIGSKNVSVNVGSPTPDDRKMIEAQFNQLQAMLQQMSGSLDATKLQMAQFQLPLLQDELMKTGANEQPSATTITRIGEWLLTNLPEIGAALVSLFTTPAVGKVVNKAGGSASEWLKKRFG